ncbi:hypothetical protein LY58_02510 [Salegentibacter salegens]|nr:hypothetical protein LY58_02510 [Salegentibacter salegens]
MMNNLLHYLREILIEFPKTWISKVHPKAPPKPIAISIHNINFKNNQL